MKEDVIACLNDLIATIKDGEEGFSTCAECVKDGHLRCLLADASKRCHAGVAELQTEVRRLGGDPDTRGTMAVNGLRAWTDVKSVVTSKDDGAILAECERGEDHALKLYRQALEEELPAETRTLLQRQFNDFKENHVSIRSLRDQFQAA